MDQLLAREIMLQGHSVLLTGPAGSGKTYVLADFIRRAKADGKGVAVTATTGLAASHLGGSTIHAWSGIGIADSLPPNFVQSLSKGRRDTIAATDVLVIDEISMLHDFRLDMVNQVAQGVRGSDLPFGGIQVVLCGDFFQLPPVSRGKQIQNGFVVGSLAWQQLNPVICYLTEQHRQNDKEFLSILNAMRAGDVRRAHAEALLARIDAPIDGAVTELHTTNQDVDWINHVQLSGVEGDEHTYHMTTTGKAQYVESLKKSCLAPQELILKEGALVMCVKNASDRKYVNGSLGTVTGFETLTDYPEVTLRNGRRIVVTPETWELRDGDKKRASLNQLPLRLAWAITVHKSQGMTLDAARIDLRRAFVEGMGYVALSRVRSLSVLSLVGINKMALAISTEALAINTALKSKAEADAKRYESLRRQAAQRESEPITAKSGKNWSAKLEAMRESYPNAFKPWLETDDNKLKALFESGKNLDEMTGVFGRQPGSIRARIKKHYGETAEIS